MFCDNCGKELSDDATFCSNCGNQVKVKKNVNVNQHKNIYLALVLTFILTGLGSIYAGNKIKGLVLLIIRISLSILGLFISIFNVFTILVWAYAFYEAYKDVQIANGHSNPKLISDFKTWDQNHKIICILIICIILILTVSACIGFIITENNYSNSHSGTHYYLSDSGSSSSSSGSSHYGGVDTSPSTIAKNDPDWYYDHYEYGDNPDIDDYLESQGYD